jgi:hypothetical protein
MYVLGKVSRRVDNERWRVSTAFERLNTYRSKWVASALVPSAPEMNQVSGSLHQAAG